MIIGLTLMVMVILSLFSIVFGNSFIAIFTHVSVDNVSITNGSIFTYTVQGQDLLFDVDPITGALAIITTVVALGTITGVQVLGSGLSPQSVRIIILLTAYTGTWSVLTILSISLLKDIELFGTLIYISLTITYAIGVIQKIGTQGG